MEIKGAKKCRPIGKDNCHTFKIMWSLMPSCHLIYLKWLPPRSVEWTTNAWRFRRFTFLKKMRKNGTLRTRYLIQNVVNIMDAILSSAKIRLRQIFFFKNRWPLILIKNQGQYSLYRFSFSWVSSNDAEVCHPINTFPLESAVTVIHGNLKIDDFVHHH